MNNMILTWVMLVMNMIGMIAFVVDFVHELKKKSMVKHVLKLQISASKKYLALDVVGFVAHLAILILITVELITQTNMQWLAIVCLVLYIPIFAVIIIRPALYNKVQEVYERLLREKMLNHGEDATYIHGEGMVYADEAYTFNEPKKENKTDTESDTTKPAKNRLVYKPYKQKRENKHE